MIKTTFLMACIFALTMAVGSLGAEELPSIPLDREEALKAESVSNDTNEGYMAGPYTESGSISVADVAEKIDNLTSTAAMTCDATAGVGLAAIPCLAVQAVNITSGIIGWFFGREPSETPEEPQGTGQETEPQIFNDPR